MEIKEFGPVMAVCESRNTRSGFAHDAVILEDGREVARCTRNYLNRTWERYRYQSAICGALEALIREELQELRREFLKRNGWQRMTAPRRNEFLGWIADPPARIAAHIEAYNLAHDKDRAPRTAANFVD